MIFSPTKYKLLTRLGAVLVLSLIVLIFTITYNKLDTTVPNVKIKFENDNNLDTSPVEYSYSYEGTDLVRGTKFGGHNVSGVMQAKTGEVVEIPSKRITNYWPLSKFTFLQINANSLKNKCVWIVRIATEDGASQYSEEDRAEIFVESNGQYLFSQLKNRIVTARCLLLE